MAMQRSSPTIVNLCPAATGTEIRETWERPSGLASYSYKLTGLDPTQDYTLQVTIISEFSDTTGRRLYLHGDTSTFIKCGRSNVPITVSITRKPNADGEMSIQHNAKALNDSADYAAALTNIMLEVGSVAHPYVPYKA